MNEKFKRRLICFLFEHSGRGWSAVLMSTFLYNGAPFVMQQAAMKLSLHPQQPEGYDNLYAKYCNENCQSGTPGQTYGKRGVDATESNGVFAPTFRPEANTRMTRPILVPPSIDIQRTRTKEERGSYTSGNIEDSEKHLVFGKPNKIAAFKRETVSPGHVPRPSKSKTASAAPAPSFVDSTADLYRGVESMLHSKGPSFESSSLQKAVSLPKLRQDLSTLRKKSSGMGEAAKLPRRSSASSLHQNNGNQSGNNKPFDYNKLKEAMAYAAQFECQINTKSLMATEGASGSSKRDPRRQGSGKRRNSGQAGKLSVYRGARGKPGKGKRGKNGAKKKGGQKHNFQSATCSASRQKKNAKLSNVQDLVKNFEQGLALQQLRAELEASKASMNASNQFIVQSMSNLRR